MPNRRAAGCKQPRTYVHYILFAGKLFFERLFYVNLRLGFFKSNMSDPCAVNTVLDSSCLCGFVFVDKKRKRIITGEFEEIFANVCKEKTKDGLPRAVWVGNAWKITAMGA